MPPRLERAFRVGLTLLLALGAALVFEQLRSPLPWMIGPLLVTAGCGMAGLQLAASNRLRNAGLWMIGVALGLYFTPAVTALLLPLAPALLAGIVWALAMGYAYYRFLLRANGEDRSHAIHQAVGGRRDDDLAAQRMAGDVPGEPFLYGRREVANHFALQIRILRHVGLDQPVIQPEFRV